MLVRGIRVSQWATERSIRKLIHRVFPGNIGVGIREHRTRDRRLCRIMWTASEEVPYEAMRALADDIEAAMPPKAKLKIKLKIECQPCDGSGMPLKERLR
jgi:hypothetical protein